MFPWHSRLVVLCAMVLGAPGCGDEQMGDESEDPAYVRPEAAPAPPPPPLPAIPAGMPVAKDGKQYLSVGLFSQVGDNWTQTSGFSWDMRYTYLTTGWVTDWEGGQYLEKYFAECAAQGAMPVLEYYAMNSLLLPGNTQADQESLFLNKVQDPTLMKSYFTDVKTLFTKAAAYKKPVLLLVEADGFGFLQAQSRILPDLTEGPDDPNAPAAVASTGISELNAAPALPNTIAGWGLAFLRLREKTGASNVLIGMHISGWSSKGGDALNGPKKTSPLPSVQPGYAFHAPLGLAANVTGQTYDFLVTDPSDRDADFYKLVGNPKGKLNGDHWWDTSDTVLITSPSFNRYAMWLRTWVDTSRKRWVMWQIPCGNSNSPNNASGGYKDNRSEYFFSPTQDGGSTAAQHRQGFADAGVLALLLGAGGGGQSSYHNDPWVDGKPFIKTYGGPALRTTPLPLQ